MLLPRIQPDPERIDPEASRIKDALPEGIECSSVLHPPCNRACPAGINVKGYIDLILQGRLEASLDLIRKDNPMAGASGFLCLRPCERECTLHEPGLPIAIRDLKRHVAQFEVSSGGAPAAGASAATGPKVAIVGAGPAGLCAARDLAVFGAAPVIFEANPEPGGLLDLCQPGFKLPRAILKADIDHVLAAGVEIRTKMRLGRDFSLDALFEQGFKAVVLATGAGAVCDGSLKGSDGAQGVIDVLAFQKGFQRDGLPSGIRRAAVLGGSQAAVTAARTLIKAGLERVYLVYDRTRNEMPADPEDVALAEQEGVTLMAECRALSLRQRSGKVAALAYERISHAARGPGRENGKPTRGRQETVSVGLVIPVAGRRVDTAIALSAPGLRLSAFGPALADPNTLHTQRSGLFVAGDLATGPRSLIEAVASGRRAARGAAAYLGLLAPLAPDGSQDVIKVEVTGQDALTRRAKGAAARRAPAGTGLDERGAALEAARCVRCGHCSACTVCSQRCEHRYYMVNSGRGSSLIRIFREQEPAFSETLSISLQCRVDPEWCIGCGRCEEACPHRAAAITLKRGGQPAAHVDPDACRFCWCCVAACPTGAIQRPCALPDPVGSARVNGPDETSEAG